MIHHLHMAPMTIMTEEDNTLGGEGRNRPTIQVKVDSLGLANLYRSTSYCVLPKTLSLSAQHMRQITDGLV